MNELEKQWEFTKNKAGHILNLIYNNKKNYQKLKHDVGNKTK